MLKVKPEIIVKVDKHFKDAYDLYNYILSMPDTCTTTNVVGDIETLWEVAMWFESEWGCEFTYVDIDKFYYDREYVLEINDARDGGCCEINICKAYDCDNNLYHVLNNTVLVQNNIDQKFFIDVNRNSFIKPDSIVVYSIDEDTDTQNESGGTTLDCVGCDDSGLITVTAADGSVITIHDCNGIITRLCNEIINIFKENN